MLASVCILLPQPSVCILLPQPQVDFFQGLEQMGKRSQHALLASLLSLASSPALSLLWGPVRGSALALHQPQDCHLALSVVSQVTWTTAATTSPGIIVFESYVFTPLPSRDPKNGMGELSRCTIGRFKKTYTEIM